MIFVILGTQKFQMNRLLKQIDQYIGDGLIQEEVIAQIGHSTYNPDHYKSYQFIDKDEFDHYISQANLVITHSGVGSIITALKHNKPVIVFPRLVKYHEHVDDHQLEIAAAFAKKEYVLCCEREDDLLELIEEAKSYNFKAYISKREHIIELINEYLVSKV